jgi:DeoR family transcriptional regulator, fructose operon transcriptional repressor
MSVDAIERLEKIRSMVDAEGRVKVADLALALDVSEMTIRRDLDLLAEQGAVLRVRGGAVAAGPQPFMERFGHHARAKERIAAKLIDLVGDGGAVGIDASTTLQRLAAAVGGVRDLTVLTNGPDTFSEMQGRPGVVPLLTGGRLDERTGSLVGPLASRAVHDFSLRRLFVSAAAVDPEIGTSESTLEDAEAKLAFADVSVQIVLAVDSSKLGKRASARCLEWDRVSLLVTELDPGDQRLDAYRDVVELG